MPLYVVGAKGADWLTFVVRASDEAEAERLAEGGAKQYLGRDYEGATVERVLDPEGPATVLLEIAA
jgi:hypothetical protein